MKPKNLRSVRKTAAATDLTRLVRQLQSLQRRGSSHTTAGKQQRRFSQLVRQHQTSALAAARAILKDRQLAEDAVQEAWLECAGRLHQLREARAFPAWFRRVIFKHCDRMMRRQSFREIPIDQTDEISTEHKHNRPDDDPQGRFMRNEERRNLRRRIVRALRTLPPAERRLTRLRFIEERSYAEIARELHINEDAVKNRVRSLRRKLRPTLRDTSFHTRLRAQSHHTARVVGLEQFRKAKLQKAPVRILMAA